MLEAFFAFVNCIINKKIKRLEKLYNILMFDFVCIYIYKKSHTSLTSKKYERHMNVKSSRCGYVIFFFTKIQSLFC